LLQKWQPIDELVLEVRWALYVFEGGLRKWKCCGCGGEFIDRLVGGSVGLAFLWGNR
jgi:hypothetical protein